MPIYEYACQSCAHRFEVKQSIKDAPLTECPRCGRHLRKLISSPAIMFKGSGWYITDYSDKLKPPSTGDGKDATSTGPNASPSGPAPAATSAASPSSNSSSQPGAQPTGSSAPGTPGAATAPSKSST